MVTTSYTDAREHLAALLDRVVKDRETVLITRRGSEPVAMIAADELESLLETVYLLRSPANAERLLAALARAKARVGSPTTVEALQAELGIEPE
ncbi:MAG TPA: type II toxin-antitoxin system prevent-host-death family antitoxin [Thermomicrobiaceae bacterium]|nr:type II toxin-antitoxin system prevent-host-death family antitoxin [Thermomicrobiaceae bacterium]